MEIDMPSVPIPPHQLSPPSDVSSQSDRKIQRLTLAVTTIKPNIQHREFIQLQKQLLHHVNAAYPTATFTLETDNSENTDEEVLPNANRETTFRVEEIIVRGKRESLITIHDVMTNLTPHEIRSAAPVADFIAEHDIGIRKHYWSKEEFDIVRPFFLLTEDPQFTLMEEVLEVVNLPYDFLDELNFMDVKAVPASSKQNKKENEDAITAAMFALEVRRKDSNKLVNLVQNHFPTNNTTLLPARFRYKQKKAWNNAVKFQRDHNRHTKNIVVRNIDPAQEILLRQQLKELKGVHGCYRKYLANPDGVFNIRIKRGLYKETVNKIESILTHLNSLDSDLPIICITRGRNQDQAPVPSWEQKSFYSATSKCFECIQLDSATGIISDITPNTASTKKKKSKKKQQKSYAQAVAPTITKTAPKKMDSKDKRIQELEEEIKKLKLQLNEKEDGIQLKDDSEKIVSASVLKNEIKDILQSHTASMKEWVQAQLDQRPLTQDAMSPEHIIASNIEKSSLAQASHKTGGGRGRGYNTPKKLPGSKPSRGKSNRFSSLLAATLANSKVDSAEVTPHKKIAQPISESDQSHDPDDDKFMDTESSIFKRPRDEVYEDDDEESQGRLKFVMLNDDVPLNQEEVEESQQTTMQDVLQQIAADIDSNSNNTSDDPQEDLQSLSREGQLSP